MTEIMTFTMLDMAYILTVSLICMIAYAMVRGWYDNQRWEKKMYKKVERYRAKYGEDMECEMEWEE